MAYKQFNDGEYTKLRKHLLRNKGSAPQRTFLNRVLSRSDFLMVFHDLETLGDDSAPVFRERLSESQFKEPPRDTEMALFEAWRDLPPSVACRASFWTHLTLEHVRQEIIDPSFLAADGTNVLTGKERIDKALQDQTAQSEKRIDDCVRAVLRRLGGLPEARGNRSVYVDCPLARAWWREHMIRQAVTEDQALANQMREALRQSQTHWEKLIDRIVFRNSTFGAKNVRNAFVLAWSQLIRESSENERKTHKELQRLCRRASALQGTRELSVLSDKALDELMREIFATERRATST